MGVRLERRGAVATMTLDWPERRNALGPVEGVELRAAIDELTAMDDVAVAILTGNGAFSAGGNLPAMAAVAAQGPEAIREIVYGTYHGVMRALVELPMPLLAAIDGPVLGLGLDLALVCDWRAIGPDGWMRQGWAEAGLIPGTGGVLLLRRLAPGMLWSMLGSRERIGPQEAERLGLAVAAPEGARAAAHARALELAALPRATLAGYVRLSRSDLHETLDRHLAACLELQVPLLCSDEFRERAERMLAARSS